MNFAKDENNLAWEKLYSYRGKVIGYLRNYFHSHYDGNQIPREDSIPIHRDYSMYDDDYENIFQDAVVLISKNIQNGKINLEDATSSTTYITRVCIYKMKETLRKQKNDIKYANIIGGSYAQSRKSSFINEKVEKIIALSPESKYMEHEKESIIRRMVLNLPSPCDKILEGFYWEGMSIRELADKYYKGSENVTKVTKHRCCEKFRKKYSDQIRKGGLHE